MGVVLAVGVSGTALAEAPDWAFLSCASGGAQVPAPDTETLPGSSRQFTHVSIIGRGAAIDWFPQSHEPMPSVVAEPQKAGHTACGYCHLADGAGRPENAKVAGLPQAYIVRELTQMRAHQRDSARAGYLPLALMRSSIEALTPEELQAAAAYFEHQKPEFFREGDRGNTHAGVRCPVASRAARMAPTQPFAAAFDGSQIIVLR